MAFLEREPKRSHHAKLPVSGSCLQRVSCRGLWLCAEWWMGALDCFASTAPGPKGRELVMGC